MSKEMYRCVKCHKEHSEDALNAVESAALLDPGCLPDGVCPECGGACWPLIKGPTVPKGQKEWDSKPVSCPYCGSKEIREIVEWEATSSEDDENTCRQTEYQCQGACEGRSFWC